MNKTDQVIDVSEDKSSNVLRNLNLFGGAFVENIKALPEDIWLLNELDLETKFKVTSTDFLIRKRLHELVVKSLNAGDPSQIGTREIFSEICTKQNFFGYLIKNPYRLAWYMMPIHMYASLIEDGFYHAIMKVRNEVLTMPVTEKSAPTILKALEFFTNRHMGPMVQRIDQRTQSMSVNLSKQVGPGEALDPEEMLQKYAEAKAKLAGAPKNAVEPDEPT